MRYSETLEIVKQKKNEALKRVENLVDLIKPGKDLLIARNRSGRIEYYCRNKEHEYYINKANSELIKELEEQNYYRKLKESEENNINLLNVVEDALNRVVEPEQVFVQIPKERRHLIQPYKGKVDEAYVSRWKPEKMEESVIRNGISYKVSNGLTVRSKSELIIAERLLAADIAFYYEFPVLIDYTMYWFPDFRVLNKRTKKEYFWEHFGLINNPEYSMNMQDKIESYARNDIVLGENLIISMESSEHPLDTDYIDKMIKQFLL